MKTFNFINTYLFGSRLYKSDHENSDYDYIHICKDEDYLELSTNNTDINSHIFTIDMFQRKLDNMDIIAIEAYFAPDSFKTENYKFTFTPNLEALRISISTITSNSWVKCKKKLTVLGDYDLNVGLKSLFHSIRILDYGIQIAKYNEIKDWSKFNYVLIDLFELSNKYNYDELWNIIDTKYRKLFLSLKAEFKSLTVKRNDNIDIDWLNKKLKKYEVPEHLIKEIFNYFK